MDWSIVYEPVSRFWVSQYFQISEQQKMESMEGIILFFWKKKKSPISPQALPFCHNHSLTKPNICAKFERNRWFELYHLLPGSAWFSFGHALKYLFCRQVWANGTTDLGWSNFFYWTLVSKQLIQPVENSASFLVFVLEREFSRLKIFSNLLVLLCQMSSNVSIIY